jgi:enamine deaminase RidA (YjgF/YER057c/UK114 family)
LKEIGAIYRNYFGKYFPAMSLVEVSTLFEDDALIEIEGIAVVNE